MKWVVVVLLSLLAWYLLMPAKHLSFAALPVPLSPLDCDGSNNYLLWLSGPVELVNPEYISDECRWDRERDNEDRNLWYDVVEGR